MLQQPHNNSHPCSGIVNEIYGVYHDGGFITWNHIFQEVNQVVVLAKEGLFANLQFQEYVVAPLCIVSDSLFSLV